MDVGAVQGAGATQELQVRMAVPEDRAPLWELMMMLHGENGLFSVSPTKVEAMLDRYYNRELAIIGVIGEPGEPVGSIYLEITQAIYSDDWMLCEQFNVVHPDHRHSPYGRQLLAYAKLCSDELRLPLMVGILSNHRTEAKMRLYERSLEKCGGYFVYGLQYADGAGRWEA